MKQNFLEEFKKEYMHYAVYKAYVIMCDILERIQDRVNDDLTNYRTVYTEVIKEVAEKYYPGSTNSVSNICNIVLRGFKTNSLKKFTLGIIIKYINKK